MEEDWLAAFMMGSILLNPQLLFYSAALGVPALVIRFTSCFLCGVVAGLCVRYLRKGKTFFTFSGFFSSSMKRANHDTDPNPAVRFLKNFGRNIKATGLYFLIGIILSALFQRYVPEEAMTLLFGKENRGVGVLMAVTIGVPLYMCGGGTIPLLMAWLSDGMSMGSATAFMITGPATKISNLGGGENRVGGKKLCPLSAFQYGIRSIERADGRLCVEDKQFVNMNRQNSIDLVLIILYCAPSAHKIPPFLLETSAVSPFSLRFFIKDRLGQRGG
jgi:uncharacterized membrane protein YraQ (UPF0718 family)